MKARLKELFSWIASVRPTAAATRSDTVSTGNNSTTSSSITGMKGCYSVYIPKLDQPFMCAPSFVIIGAPKAGTTSLYHYLSQVWCGVVWCGGMMRDDDDEGL